jgi:hypothetical protein
MSINPALRFRQTTLRLTALAVLALVVAPLTRAETSSQLTFASPEAASRALFVAAKSHDEQALEQILGATPSPAEKRDEERLEREQFAKKYEEMHRLAHHRNGQTVLYIGAENWPFPIPLVSQNSTWRFDAATGEKEILFRRIGENELAAIEICRSLTTAAHDTQAHQDDELLSTLLANEQHDGTPTVYRGYHFRVLNRGRGDFAVIAYPAAYRSSGVMTFIVGRRTAVYAKDLGTNTTQLANEMKGYHSDKSWKKEEPATASP